MKGMKKIKTFVTMVTAIAMLLFVPKVTSLTASAATPTTYSVKYLPSERAWRYQANTSTFDDNAYHRELYYLYQVLKDGDLVVVYYDSSDAPSLNLGDVHLSNLTVVQSSAISVIYTGGIDDCYLLAGTACAINGDVTNAHVYDSALCNFNGNVKNLNIYAGDDMTSTVGCGGTVEHLHATSSSRTYYNLFNFKANTLSIQNGTLQTAAEDYRTTPAAPKLTRQNFDYMRYANDYADLKAAFGYNAAALYNHYITYGIVEGRIVYSTLESRNNDFDYVRYANDYADLKKAFGYDANALFNHYLTYGIKEGRTAYTTYDTIFTQ